MAQAQKAASGREPEYRSRRRHPALVLAGVAATSAAGLAFEISLTRGFAVAQFYHFAFLSVSLALLGLGASGSALTALPGLGRGGPRRWAGYSAAQALTTLGAYLLTNVLPFDSFAIAWDPRQVLYLVVYYLALAVPFFFAGLIVASLLAGADQPDRVPSHRIYGASLAGSGAGAAAALGGLAWLGGEGAIAFSAAIAMAGAAAFAHAAEPRRDARLAAAATAALLIVAAAVPAPLAMNLSPYKELSSVLRYPGAEVVSTEWDAGTRIDLVRSDGIRSLPGLSLAYPGVPPRQDGLTFDGDDLSPVSRTSPTAADFAPYLVTSVAYALRPSARALILEPRGGLDVIAALAMGATSVRAVEPHQAAVAATRAIGPSVYDDPRVTVDHAEPRTFVERANERFDVIDLALTSPYRPVASGAYSLAEDYRLTVDAFGRYLERLEPGGVLMVARWVQVPPSEEIRLFATGVAALRNAQLDPAAATVMLRGYATSVLLLKPDGFTPADLSVIVGFAEQRQFDVVAAPGSDPARANRFNVVPDEQYSTLAAALLGSLDPTPIYANHEFDIRPATDDHPFFGHFFTWSQAGAVLDTLGRTWQPFGGAGYFVLVALLGISTVAAIVLIATPLLARRPRQDTGDGRMRWWTVGYFGLLGLAFLFVEIPLIQQFILLIGRPTSAFAVVVFAVLVASGVGSAWSRRIGWRSGAVLLTAAAALYPSFVRWLTPLALPAPAPVRMALVAAMIAPLGLLMGIMFPWGLAHLERRAAGLVPWAWAINGTVSVISAAAAALLALSFGFSFVVRLGAVAYAGAALLARPRPAVAGVTPRRE